MTILRGRQGGNFNSCFTDKETEAQKSPGSRLVTALYHLYLGPLHVEVFWQGPESAISLLNPNCIDILCELSSP